MKTLEFVGYAKKFCVALAAALAILATALLDQSVSTAEWVQIAIAFVSALGVYQVTNVNKEK